MARCLTLLQTKIIFSEYLFCYCQKDFDMDARNNLKIIHTVDGAILQNRMARLLSEATTSALSVFRQVRS